MQFEQLTILNSRILMRLFNFTISFSKKLIAPIKTSGYVWKHGILCCETCLKKCKIVLIEVLFIQYVAHSV